MKFTVNAVALAATLFVGASQAAVLYENGTNGDFSGGNNPFTYQMVTDDFVLGQSGTVNTVTYNAFTTSNTQPVTNVEVSIFANNAGTLGALLFHGNFGVSAQSVIGQDSEYDLTDYSVNVGAWNLNAGSYYLGLQVSPNQWDEHWSIPKQSIGQTGSDGSDHYFRLESTVSAVPEPETYAMMLAGLGLMGAVARRRKQK